MLLDAFVVVVVVVVAGVAVEFSARGSTATFGALTSAFGALDPTTLVDSVGPVVVVLSVVRYGPFPFTFLIISAPALTYSVALWTASSNPLTDLASVLSVDVTPALLVLAEVCDVEALVEELEAEVTESDDFVEALVEELDVEVCEWYNFVVAGFSVGFSLGFWVENIVFLVMVGFSLGFWAEKIVFLVVVVVVQLLVGVEMLGVSAEAAQV